MPDRVIIKKNNRRVKNESRVKIGYGCLLPEKKERLLLCGRNISGTHIAHSNFRAMPICVGTGEAAGAAAAIAVKNNCLLKDIDAKEIQRTVGI